MGRATLGSLWMNLLSCSPNITKQPVSRFSPCDRYSSPVFEEVPAGFVLSHLGGEYWDMSNSSNFLDSTEVENLRQEVDIKWKTLIRGSFQRGTYL